MVPVVGFMWAVVSAIVLYAILNRWFGDTTKTQVHEKIETNGNGKTTTQEKSTSLADPELKEK